MAKKSICFQLNKALSFESFWIYYFDAEWISTATFQVKFTLQIDPVNFIRFCANREENFLLSVDFAWNGGILSCPNFKHPSIYGWNVNV